MRPHPNILESISSTYLGTQILRDSFLLFRIANHSERTNSKGSFIFYKENSFWTFIQDGSFLCICAIAHLSKNVWCLVLINRNI